MSYLELLRFFDYLGEQFDLIINFHDYKPEDTMKKLQDEILEVRNSIEIMLEENQ